MFRSKEFLVAKGMGQGCRPDTFYLIGTFYDEFVDKGIDLTDIDKIQKTRVYLDKHRELINLDKPIIRMQSLFTAFGRINIKCNFDMSEYVEDESLLILNTPYEKKVTKPIVKKVKEEVAFLENQRYPLTIKKKSSLFC